MINILLLLIINISAEDNIKKGIRKYNKGKYEDAIFEFSKVEKRKKDFEYYFYVGHSYSFAGMNEISISYYDSAYFLNNESDKLFFERGLSNFIIGESNNALKDLDKAIDINPRNAKYYINRGSIKYDLGLIESACDDWYFAISLDKKIIDESIIKINCN